MVFGLFFLFTAMLILWEAKRIVQAGLWHPAAKVQIVAYLIANSVLTAIFYSKNADYQTYPRLFMTFLQFGILALLSQIDILDYIRSGKMEEFFKYIDELGNGNEDQKSNPNEGDEGD